MTAFTERWHEYLRASKAQERTSIGVLTRGAPASAALEGVVQRRLAHHISVRARTSVSGCGGTANPLKIGAAGGNRTHDIQLGKLTFYL
jgi:hypothetical protein